MILDYNLRLRDGGTTVLVDDSEAGTTTTLSRVATTGQAVLDIRKTPRLRGLACVVTNTAGVYTTTGDTFVVTIQAANEADFDGGAGTIDTVATFPSLVETGVTAVIAANVMVRRFHTQKRYLRSVLTVSAALDTGVTLGIFVGDMIEEED